MSPEQISFGQLPSGICETLRQKIVTLEIKPGTGLRERILAEEMGVSRTPVREALFALEAEGLVRRYPKLGFVVAELTLRDVMESFQIREFIEPPAAAIAAKLLNVDALRELQSMLENLAFADDVEHRNAQHNIIDVKLHNLILDAVGNSRITYILKNINGVCERARCLGTSVRFYESTNEHLELIKELIARDSGRSEACMRKHLEEAKKRIILYI